MAEPVNVNLLHGRWVHAREEDTPTEQVYRRAGAPLPPSRGRSGLEFDADGTFKRIGIGATDISSVTQGEWRVDPAKAGRVQVEAGGAPQSLEIQSLDSDRLTVKRPP
jgi:hypothetical protein